MSKSYDDVIKWKHFPRYWPFVRGIYRWPADSPHKGQWRGALMFTLICAWINGWANNQDAGETSLRSLWRHCNESATSITGLELPRMTRMRPGSAICIWMDFWDNFELDQQNMIFIIADARPLWKTVRKPADQVPFHRSRMYLRGKSNHPNDKIRNMG